MKIAVIIYHKNIFNFIDPNILLESLQSIQEQTFDDFDIFELDYSDYTEKEIQLTNGIFKQKKYFYRKECRNHIEAMNYLLNKTFNELNYDIVFNVNLDDIYNIHRFEIQLRKILLEDYSLVCSNYTIFKNENNIELEKNIKMSYDFENKEEEKIILNVKLSNKKMIIPLSSFCFTKKSWDIIKKIDYLPTLESLLIFKKLISSNLDIHICHEYLLKYRIHKNQSTIKYRNIYL